MIDGLTMANCCGGWALIEVRLIRLTSVKVVVEDKGQDVYSAHGHAPETHLVSCSYIVERPIVV